MGEAKQVVGGASVLQLNILVEQVMLQSYIRSRC